MLLGYGAIRPRTHAELGLATYGLNLLGRRTIVIFVAVQLLLLLLLLLLIVIPLNIVSISVHGARSLVHQLGLSKLLLTDEWAHLDHGILAPELLLELFRAGWTCIIHCGVCSLLLRNVQIVIAAG